MNEQKHGRCPAYLSPVPKTCDCPPFRLCAHLMGGKWGSKCAADVSGMCHHCDLVGVGMGWTVDSSRGLFSLASGFS